MSFPISCICGRKLAVHDVRLGDTVVCDECGKLVAVPFPARPSSGPSLIWILPALLIGLLIFCVTVVVVGKRVLGQARRTPVPRESAEERRHAVSEAFGPGDASKDPAGDERDARAAVDRLVAAMKAGDAVKFSAGINSVRLWSEISSYPGVAVSRSTAQDRAEVRQIGIEMQTLCRNTPEATRWQSARVTRARPVPGRAEMQVFAYVSLGQVRSKFRFWVVRDSGTWKVFDWELLEEANRLSTLFASIIQAKSQEKGLIQRGQPISQSIVRANALLTQGDAEAALREIRSARASRPPAHLQDAVDLIEANTLIVLGRNEEALPLLDAVLARKRDLPLAWSSKGNALRALDRPEEAAAAYRENLVLLGDDPEVLHWLGEVLEKSGKADEALAAYRRGAASDAEDVDNRSAVARMLLERGARAEAGTLLRELVQRVPAQYYAAAGLLRRSEAWAELLELARDLGRREEKAQALYDQGWALRKLARPKEAEEAYRAGMAKTEETGRSSYEEELAYAAFEQGKEKEALEWADRLSARTGGEGSFVRAWIHASARRLDEAEKELLALLAVQYYDHEEVEHEKAFEPVRERPAVKAALARAKAKTDFEHKAEAYAEEENWDDLLKLATERAKAAPDDFDAFVYQGGAHSGLGRHPEAEKAYRAALEKAPEDQRIRSNLGFSILRQGRTEEVMALAGSILALADARSTGLYLRAAAHAVAKREEEAAKDLKELLTALPFYRLTAESEPLLKDVLKRPDLQELLKKLKETDEER